MTPSETGWGRGYVTDIAYLPGYYPHQSPLHLNLACLLGGVAGIAVRPDQPLSLLELGCGYGFGALVLAASNPVWRVTAVDFNPAHIAAARELAAAAGIANARFLEADLAALADGPLAREIPEADVITLHGLWSWVGDAARAGIVRLAAAKLRPGGLFHLSYNALPAWQGALGMQRLLRETGRRSPGRSDRQIAAGFDLVRALAKAEATHLRDRALVQPLLAHAERTPAAYLAHEYLNADWRPSFHADVVRDLAAAKLDWAGSAALLEAFSPLMLGGEARAVLQTFDDPVMRELVKDMCLPRSLRQDVFVRGARRLSEAERDRALGEVMLALLCSEARFSWEIDVPAGRATIERGFFGPLVAALAEGPRRVRDLLALPGLPRRDNPGEVVGMLVGTGQAMPVLAPAAAPDARVGRLNQAAAQRFARADTLATPMALATAGTGAPLPCPLLDLFIADRLHAEAAADPAAWAGSLAAGQPPEEEARLRTVIEGILAERLPIWRRLGALPPARQAPV